MSEFPTPPVPLVSSGLPLDRRPIRACCGLLGKAISAAALVAPIILGSASAQELREIQNYSIHLGPVVGSVYFDRIGPDALLVATLSSGPDATPIRMLTTLAAGQRAVVSVPQGPGQPALQVIFWRQGDHILVEDGDSLVGSIR